MAALASKGNPMHSNKENMGNNFGGSRPRDGGFKKDRGYNDGGYNKGRNDFSQGRFGGGGNRREPREFGREFNGNNFGHSDGRKLKTNYNGFDDEPVTQPSSHHHN